MVEDLIIFRDVLIKMAKILAPCFIGAGFVVMIIGPKKIMNLLK